MPATPRRPIILVRAVRHGIADLVVGERLAVVGGQAVAAGVGITASGCDGRAGDGGGFGVGVLCSASLLLRVGRLFLMQGVGMP